MGSLANELEAVMPQRLGQAGIPDTTWVRVAQNLKKSGLEAALDDLAGDDPSLPILVTATADIIQACEERAIAQIMSPNERYPLQELLCYISKSSASADVITTNYDRLIELACALAAIPVDTGFNGHTIGTYDEAASREALVSVRRLPRGQTSFSYRHHVRLAKPHGSLDWFKHKGEPVRSEIAFGGQPLIITPGLSKYKTGYERPFDAQKNRATGAIDRANALLFLGYGFNDDHLQTHLNPQFSRGVKTAVFARSLTEAAVSYIQDFPHILAIDSWPGQSDSSRIHFQGQTLKVESVALWDLGTLISEVLV